MKHAIFPHMQARPISRRERPAKSPLSREAIVKVALGLLKKEGLKKVTMRRIAKALDTGPASLYVYVRDTEDLHAQILDALLANLPTPKPARSWRADLTHLAEAYLDVLMRYPEIARLTMATHATGPSSMRLFDTVAGLLIKAGADTRAAAWGVDLVLAFVTATAAEHGGRKDEDAELDTLRETMDAVDARVHPHLAKLQAEMVSGKGQRFRWGLDVLVRGILSA